MGPHPMYQPFFFFNDTATTEIYTLSLHDALPIWLTDTEAWNRRHNPGIDVQAQAGRTGWSTIFADRKSTRLNSSHQIISYAVFCLKKKHPHHPHRLPKHPLVTHASRFSLRHRPHL